MTEKVSPQRGVEEQLKEAEPKLRDPPTSVDELLRLLDQVEKLLMGVEQSPAKSVLDAISPITDAVVSDVLFRHLNDDVKVAVASCISEVTRITAPDAPYDDDRLKEVFQLIVSSFEKLSDKSSKSYTKRVRILHTVANVRSCVVMLDLECDDLIVQMFKIFLATIGDSHSEKVFSSMETIMVLVIEESEEISSDLLAPLLAYLKKDNQEGPVAVRLAEKVIEKCAAELRPYLSVAIESLDDYTEAVTAVVKGPPASVVNSDEIASTDPQVQKNVDADENVSGPSMDADENASEPPNSVMDNGVDDNGKENPGIGAKVEASVCASEKSRQDNEPSADKFTSQSEDDESETQKPHMVELKLRGGKPNSPMNDSDGEKEAENQLDVPEIIEKDSPDSSREEDALAVSKSPDMGTVKAKPSDSASIESSSQGESIHDDDHPKKTGKKRSVQEEPPSVDIASKKAKAARSVKKAPLKKKDKILVDVDTSKIESEGVSDSKKEKKMKQLGKKMNESSNTLDGYSVGKNVENKRRRKTKDEAAGDHQKKSLSTMSSSKSSKDEETPKMSSKRKRAASQQKATENKLDASLVGSRVKVWWPEDKQYYEGVVKSYDPIKKKHEVLYDDGEKENLSLNKERWEIIDDDPVSSEDQDAETPSPDATSGLRKRAKAKLNTKPLAKAGKSDVSLKSEAASSKKSKGATPKQGQNDKRAESPPKTSIKSKDAGGSWSKGKGKSKLDSPKTSSKSKQDSLRIGGKSKPDSAKTGVKSKTKVADGAKTSGGKGKSKAQAVEGSAKKRRRVA